MKKTILLLSYFLVSSFVCLANQGGPDAYGYTWKDSNEPGGPIYNWFDITAIGTPVTTLLDDNTDGPFSLGSNFNFYGQSKSQCWIASNGYIAFNNLYTSLPWGTNIPDTAGQEDFITGVFADYTFTGVGNTAQCFYYSNSDTFCVSFINVPFLDFTPQGYTGNNSFQVILNKTDSSITVNIQAQTGLTFGNDIRIGIENSTGSIGLQPLSNIYPPINYSIKYYPPSPSSVFEMNNKNNISLFPNPTIGIFTIFISPLSLGRGVGGEVEIYNPLGEIIYKTQITQQQTEINLSNKPKGIYFLKIVAEDKIYSQKLIIQ